PGCPGPRDTVAARPCTWTTIATGAADLGNSYVPLQVAAISAGLVRERVRHRRPSPARAPRGRSPIAADAGDTNRGRCSYSSVRSLDSATGVLRRRPGTVRPAPALRRVARGPRRKA